MTHDTNGAPEHVRIRVRRLAHGAGLPLPAYQSAGAAGMDVHAAVTGTQVVRPGEVGRIPTGLALEVPAGFEVQLRPRSGLAARHGITLANSPATIDSDYRGEVLVLLANHGSADFVVERGMRVAQMVLGRVPLIVWDEADDLAPTARGGGGFGHTGVE
jgi:dUTP pyrophosphatase